MPTETPKFTVHIYVRPTSKFSRSELAAPSKIWTVFFRSKSRIVSSNHTRDMDVCLSLFCVCVCSALPTRWPPPKSPTDCPRIKKLRWNKAFHRCPMFQVRATGKRKRERERPLNLGHVAAGVMSSYALNLRRASLTASTLCSQMLRVDSECPQKNCSAVFKRKSLLFISEYGIASTYVILYVWTTRHLAVCRASRKWNMRHPQNWVFLEMTPVVYLLKNFPTFSGTRSFIIVSTSTCYLSLFWARRIQSMAAHPISLRSVFI
jgi:hypothetical protein